MLSTSPDRETTKTENLQYAEFQKSWIERQRLSEQTPEWSVDNLEFDLRSTDWILQKVRDSDEYAAALYAALCNNDFQKQEIIPILKDQSWSCSFRYAGGIIADMRGEGSYIDWYCSGPEGVVSDEIRDDLKRLGWAVVTQEQ